MISGRMGLAALAAMMLGAAVPAQPPALEPSLGRALDAWVRMWNSYDLDQVNRLFVVGRDVTYL